MIYRSIQTRLCVNSDSIIKSIIISLDSVGNPMSIVKFSVVAECDLIQYTTELKTIGGINVYKEDNAICLISLDPNVSFEEEHNTLIVVTNI